MNDQDTDMVAVVADQLNNADMLVDDFESYNNDRQDTEDVAIINPEETPAEPTDSVLANDCMSLRRLRSALGPQFLARVPHPRSRGIHFIP